MSRTPKIPPIRQESRWITYDGLAHGSAEAAATHNRTRYLVDWLSVFVPVVDAEHLAAMLQRDFAIMPREQP
jgi:hypothetical protein